MIDFGIKIDLLDGVTDIVSDIMGSFKGLDLGIKATADSINDLKKASSDIKLYERLSKNAKTYNDRVDIQKKKVQELQDVLQKKGRLTEREERRHQKSLDQTTAKIQKLQSALESETAMSERQQRRKQQQLERTTAKAEKLNRILANEGKLTAKQQAMREEQLKRATTQLNNLVEKQDQLNTSLKETGSRLDAAGVDTRDLANEQKRLGQQIQKTTQRLASKKNALKGIGDIGSGLKNTFSGLLDITKKITVAGIGATAIAGGIGKGFLDTASEAERFKSILTTLEGGNTRKAQEAFNWIGDFAATTPYELANVTEAFVQLRAYGIDPIEDDALRTMGDTAAAMGKDIMQVVEAVADGITGENERLKELGIKASSKGNKITYNYTDKEGKQRTKSVDKNNRKMIQSTLQAIWNEKYAGAMDDMSNTWQGMTSNLSDQWARFQTMVMDAGAFDFLKGELEDLLFEIDFLSRSGDLQAWAKQLSGEIVTTAVAIKDGAIAFYDFSQSVISVTSGIADFVGGWDNLLIGLLAIKGIFMAGGIITGLSGIATGVTAIGAAAGIATFPLWGTVAAIGAIAAAWYFWEDIMSWLETNFPAVHDFFAISIPTAIDSTVEAFNKAMKWAHDLGKTLESLTKSPYKIGLEIGQTMKGTGNVFDAGKALGKKFFGGGRATGGPVEAGRMYEVNELGLPEFFSTGDKQFLMPHTSGEVIPIRQPQNTLINQMQGQTQTNIGNGRLDIHIESPVPAKVKHLESDGMDIDVHTGPMGVFAS